MSVHCIRLIGPWDYVWQPSAPVCSEGRPIAQTGTLKMPCSWESVFGSQGGVGIFSRRFHRPTNLDAHEAVLIVLTGVGARGTIRLNGATLREFEREDSTEVDVKKWLLPFNVLEIELEYHPAEGTVGGLHQPVILEIRQS